MARRLEPEGLERIRRDGHSEKAAQRETGLEKERMTNRRKIWDEFTSKVCPNCRGAKSPNNGFCRACYYSLPKTLRAPMWHRFGDGYEEAHEEARQWLSERKAA